MIFSPDQLHRDLQAHSGLSNELLELAHRENQMLRAAQEFVPGLNDCRRRTLLERFEQALAALRAHRVAWQKLPEAEKARHPELARRIRAAQELAMKIIVLGRENEQLLLRRGLLPPRHLPAASKQANQVASLYQRQRQMLP